MDVNETLRQIRAALAALDAAADGDNDAEIEAGHELAELVISLDEWLSRGGFLPTAWQRS